WEAHVALERTAQLDAVRKWQRARDLSVLQVRNLVPMFGVAARQVSFQACVVAETQQVGVVRLGARIFEQPVQSEATKEGCAFGEPRLELEPETVEGSLVSVRRRVERVDGRLRRSTGR